MFKNDSETVYENVTFTFEKGMEYKLPMNAIRRFTKIVHGQSSDDDDDPDKPELISKIPAPPTAVRTTIPSSAAITTTISARGSGFLVSKINTWYIPPLLVSTFYLPP